MNFFAFSLTFLLAVFGLAASETKEFDATGLKSLKLENTSGHATITAVEGEKASVTANKKKFSDSCEMTIEKAGSRLLVKVNSTQTFTVEECEVDFEVKVPKTMDLNFVVGSGDLTIKGVNGTLSFKLGSGDIFADGTFKKVSGATGSGKVDIKGLTGGGQLDTGSGEMNLSFAASALKGALDLKTGSGDAILHFPKDAQIKTSFRAGSGELSNELGDNPKAEFAVSMRAGSGNLKIKTY